MTAAITVAGSLDVAALVAAYARLSGRNAPARTFSTEEERSRLGRLSRTFSLSPLERDLLLFAAAADVAPAIPDARAVLDAAGQTPDRRPCVQSAYDLFGGGVEWLAFRNALREDAPLRRWHLLSLSDAGEPLPSRGMSADPRVVDFLL
ncbi:MAG TPA: hypothetical protein VHV78_01470, partial [Gemmatimonadaceae bacterium]|nr:hypothetical protein [Gemmatimonadaceae bacterium]